MNRSEFLKLIGLGVAVVGTGVIGATPPPILKENVTINDDGEWVYGIYDGEDIRFLNDNDMAPVHIDLGRGFVPGDVVRWQRDTSPKNSQRLFTAKSTD